MSESTSKNTSIPSHEEEEPEEMPWWWTAGAPVAVPRWKSPRNKQRKVSPNRKLFGFPKTIPEVKQHLATIISHFHGNGIAPAVSVWAIRASLTVQLEWPESVKKGRLQGQAEEAKNQQAICKPFGLGLNACSSIMQDHLSKLLCMHWKSRVMVALVVDSKPKCAFRVWKQNSWWCATLFDSNTQWKKPQWCKSQNSCWKMVHLKSLWTNSMLTKRKKIPFAERTLARKQEGECGVKPCESWKERQISKDNGPKLFSSQGRKAPWSVPWWKLHSSSLPNGNHQRICVIQQTCTSVAKRQAQGKATLHCVHHPRTFSWSQRIARQQWRHHSTFMVGLLPHSQMRPQRRLSQGVQLKELHGMVQESVDEWARLPIPHCHGQSQAPLHAWWLCPKDCEDAQSGILFFFDGKACLTQRRWHCCKPEEEGKATHHWQWTMADSASHRRERAQDSLDTTWTQWSAANQTCVGPSNGECLPAMQQKQKISNTHEQLMEQAEPFDTEEGLAHTQKVTEKCHHTLLIIWNEVTKDKNDIDIEAVVEESKNDEAEGSSSNSDASSPSSPESSEASEDSTVGVWQHQMLPFLLRRPPWLMCWIVRSGENSIQVLKTTQWFSLTCKSCNCNLHLSCLITLSKKEFPLFLAAWMCSSYSKWQASDGFGVVFTCGTLSIPLSICSQLFHMWSILNTHTQIVMVWGQVARFQWLMMNWQFVKQQVKTLMTHSFCEIVGARFKGNCQSRGIQDSGFVNECGWNGWDDGIYMVPWFEEARRHALYVTW